MKILETLNGTRYLQYFAALNVALSITGYAVHVTWPSPTLPKLTSTESPITVTLTQSEASWVAASASMSLAPGAILGAWIFSKFGPKTTLLVSSAPMFFPWFAIIFAKSALTLFIARFIAGIGGGVAATTIPIYIGEISAKDIRGKLGTTYNMMRIMGGVLVLAIGPFVSYLALAITCSFIPLTFVMIFWFMPESPYYLIKINRREEARKNLIRLSSSNTGGLAIQAHLDEINTTVQHDMKNRSTFWELLTKPEYRKALFIMTGVKILQQFNGSVAIESYMQTIIKESKSSISPEMSSIIFGAIQIPAVLIAAATVDKVGRKPLLIISALGCAVALFAEGLYFYLYHNSNYGEVVEALSWLPTSSLVLYLIMNPIGLFTVPFILLGEMFPTNVKYHAVAFFTAIGGSFAFIVVKLFEPIATSCGIYTVFWLFTTICILGATFVYFLLPETKGKTFMEIQNKLNKPTRTEMTVL